MAKTKTLNIRLLRDGYAIENAFSPSFSPGAERALERRPWTGVDGASLFIASAAAFAFLDGMRRDVSGGELGVHQFYSEFLSTIQRRRSLAPWMCRGINS
jgi:hypothetical protein